MRVDAFDFVLPDERIAVRPAVPRDASRLLVVHPDGALEHATVRDLPKHLRAGDSLVLNDTKVFRARLRGVVVGRGDGNSKIELLLLHRLAPNRFSAFARPARKLSPGTVLQFGAGLTATVDRRGEGGEAALTFALSGAALDAAIAVAGEIPLPPYIAKRRAADPQDAVDYQTVFARHEGSVAAPTAGLHFTPELLGTLRGQGIAQETVTLHVGAGTFQPVGTEDTAEHRMHSEWATIAADTASRLNAARRRGGRTVAVGTTSLRTLESAAREDGTLAPFEAETDIFILPGYCFRATDVLLTNFHLPRSTLFMLVCAFSGTEIMRAAYDTAIREHYRFYSYGDACLLLRPPS